MGRYKKTTYPGSIIVRSNRLYVCLKQKQYATGLHNTPDGRAKAEIIRQELYEKLMQDKGLLPKPKKFEKITVNEAFELFKTNLRLKNRSETTIYHYELAKNKIVSGNYALTARIDNAEPESQLKLIADVEKFVYGNTKLAPASINIHLRSFKAFLYYCAEENLIPKINILKKYGKAAPQKEIMPHEDYEYKALYEYFVKIDYEYALWLKFLWNTGARRKESLELTWAQIDFKKQSISFPNKIKKEKIEEFPINDNIKAILLEIQNISKARVYHKERLFRWEPASVSFLSKRLKKAEIELGIYMPDRGFHGFRKAFGTKLIENDVSIYDVKDLMRHSSIDTTLKFYKKIKIGRLSDILNRVDKNEAKTKKKQ